ncbi:LysR family transcriptional regulator [Bordetella sp. H567]|uniref:LysR family transcriptional regulator n=1 Tax=Bordetella sp. H567 TaxID=1697043 RepID=UPI000A5EE6D0|nr:LysR family transcriptional regulator [Bordetella sp. H567]
MRYFAHVARAGSFSRAAQELYIAQPALSRQIRKLEEELGVALLARHGRGVRLTGAGARLLERAEMIADFVRQTEDHVRQEGDALSGHVALGLPTGVAMMVGRRVIEAFRARWPQVSLHVREGLSTSLQEWVLNGRVDLAVLHNPPPLDRLDVEPVIAEPMVLVAPPDAGLPGAPGRARRLADVQALPLILPGLPHANRRLIEQSAVQSGLRLRVIMEIDSLALTRDLVAGGLGYSILTYAAVQDDAAAGRVAAYPIERPAIPSIVAIAALRESRAVRATQAMRSVLRAALRDHVTSGAWRGNAAWLGDG